jgi:DNA modification methylase
MGGERADCGIHDAPYNVNMQRSGSIAGDKQTAEQFGDFSRAWVRNFAAVCASDCAMFVCIGFREYPLIAGICREIWDEKNCIVWAKPSIGMGGLNGGYRYQHELIWFGGSKPVSNKAMGDVWQFDRDSELLHPTLKPTPLIEKMINDVGASIVADFFAGSGTTIIACENLSRRCRACEISPGYVGVALERYFQHTGVQPVLLESAAR